jgi:hypothetical protein
MVKQKAFAMQTHALIELEESLNRGKPLGIDESLALVNEIWRLKTALTGKNIDLGYWRDSYTQSKAECERIIAENHRLNEEIGALMALIGLPNCELENRWSNCALRRVKLACVAEARRDPGEESPKLLSWEP